MAPFLLLLVFVLLPSASPLPLCTNLRAPITPKTPLSFCSYNGSSCCNATQDAALQKQFNFMNISNDACGSFVKSILCTRCDPFSANLFTAESKIRTVPLLCNSPLSVSSSQSKDSTKDFCQQVWDTCKDVPILKSPFAPSLQGSTQVPASSISKLTDLWQSKNDFCNAFGGSISSDSVCFDGKSVLLNGTQSPPAPKGLCLEKIGNGFYLNMVPHPDGSNRVFVSSQDGKIWLATVPEQGSGGTLQLDESNPFLDLTDAVLFDTVFGMMGLAFHPEFAKNGRFFVSYNCDRNKSPNCVGPAGRCACNSEVGCDPSKLSPDNGAQPCQFYSVVAEYIAQSPTNFSLATSANPTEVRRIMTLGLPSKSNHGGQILFGPTDRYMYFMMGDGSQSDDPYNLAQNKKSVLGKIMRLDINNFPSAKEQVDLGLWGNYSIPKDNPYADDSELRPEVWAFGLKNPWRCSFDSAKPSYFYCGDVGQNTYEEVDLISKSGNYGWRVYEGPDLFNSKSTANGNVTTPSIDAIPPVMGYKHITQSAAITGGHVYRSNEDPCMSGRYLFADLYQSFWVGTETPENSGNYVSTSIPFACASDSPTPCEPVAGSSAPAMGYIVSFGEDNRKDVYVLAQKGVYRIVRPSRCNYTCSIEGAPPPKGPALGSPSSSSSWAEMLREKMLFFSLLVLFAFSVNF